MASAAEGSALLSMIEALGLEVAAIRKKGGSTQVELQGGERIGETEGHFLYRFPLPGDVVLRDDSPIRLVSGQSETDGSIVSVRDSVIILALEEDLGPRITHARLIADESFLIERLKTALEEVASGERAFNTACAGRCIGEQEARASDGVVPKEVLAGDPPLDADKMTAIRRAMGSDTCFVWGPPGTGKTTTIARIAEAYFRIGKSVLLVSNTNAAVDVAMEKVANRLAGTDEFDGGKVLRFGPAVKPELIAKYGDRVVLEQVVARLGEDLERERIQTRRSLEQHEAEGAEYQRALQSHATVQAATGEVEELTRQVDHARKRLKEASRAVVSGEGQLATLRKRLTVAESAGTLRRLVQNLNPAKLRIRIVAAEQQLTSLKTDQTMVSRELGDQRDVLASRQSRLETLSREASLLPSADECRQQLESLDGLMRPLRDRLQTIEQELSGLRQRLLAECRLLATTVYRTFLKGQVERSFDVVIVDEASMLMLPMSYYAAGRANDAVIVSGDFRQLPPIVMSKDEQALTWLKRDVFEAEGIPEAIGAGREPSHLVALTTQYRMREPICGVVNQLFYDDRPLRTDAGVRDRPIDRAFPLGEGPLFLVDTSTLHPWAAFKPGTYSRYNLLQALLVRSLTVALNDAGYVIGDFEAARNLAIIAPYAAQTRLLQGLLEDRLGDRAKGGAATVHRYQGNEKTAVIVDLTDSFGARLGRFMKAINKREDGARLLNVAVSRARDKIILVANVEYLRNKSPAGGFTQQLLDIFEDGAERVDPRTSLPLGDREWFDGLGRITPPAFEFDASSAGIFTEGTYLSPLMGDVQRAGQNVVVFSPFLTERGTARWADAFRNAASRGVRVRVVTRPPGDQGGVLDETADEVIRQLEGLGVVVDLRGRMHEKLVLVDGEILWCGSLNVLSHRDTGEVMMRLPSRAACASMAQLVSTPTPGGRGTPDITGRENPKCAACGAPTIWRTGRYGIYFECTACGEKVNAHQRRSRARGRRHSPQTRPSRPCPRCDGQLRLRNGRFGEFLGCSNYPRCRYTEKAGA